MAVFPTGPSVGDTFHAGSNLYSWTGNEWKIVAGDRPDYGVVTFAPLSAQNLFHFDDESTTAPVNSGFLGNAAIQNYDSSDVTYPNSGAGAAFGKAIALNTPAGSTSKMSYLTMPEPTIGTSECTIEWWMSLKGFVADGTRYIVTNSGSTGYGSFSIRVYHDYNPDETSIRLIDYSSGSGVGAGLNQIYWNDLDCGVQVAGGDGPWRHCALVRTLSGTTCTWNLYYNGSLQTATGNTQTSYLVTDLNHLSGDWTVGRGQGNYTGIMKGSLDELAIFDYAKYSGSTYTIPTASYIGPKEAPATIAGKSQIYAKDVAGVIELYMKDGAGAETKLT